jgi:hypothetical protein
VHRTRPGSTAPQPSIKEPAMHAEPPPYRAHPLTAVIASALATIVAVATLSAVALLFQSRGLPLEEFVVAEHACAGFAYASERERCVQEWVAAAHGRRVAQR